MATFPVVYTDEDVRPDLLTAEERSRFPETLDNVHRRQILDITRCRIDAKDWLGRDILPPEQWLDRWFGAGRQGGDDVSAMLADTVTSDVVIPYSGVCHPIDMGMADIVQRLMDRGLVVDVETSRSGLVADRPNERWIHESPSPAINGQPGQLIADTPGEVPMKIHFPVDNTLRHYNDARALDIISRAAAEAGLDFTVRPFGSGDRLMGELTLPYLMDGTGWRDCMHEARTAAFDATGGSVTGRAWTEAVRTAKASVVEAHGGYARFTDSMTLDRLSRFERSVQRLVLQHPDFNRRITGGIDHADFLTAAQMHGVERSMELLRHNLYDERVEPHIRSEYREDADRVDEVARMAGYRNFTDCMTLRRRPVSDDEAQRWATFRQLEQQYLTPDHAGRIKVFRIRSGISQAVHEARQDECRRLAADTVARYRQCGYPVDRLTHVTLVTDAAGATQAFAYIDGVMSSAGVSAEDINRLRLQATTPYEVALTGFADRLGYRGGIAFDVSQQTVSALGLADGAGRGHMPLVCGSDVYHVDEATYHRAHALTRFEGLAPWLRQRVLSEHPPVRRADVLDTTALVGRLDRLASQLTERMTDVSLVKTESGRSLVRCRVGGVQQPAVWLTDAEMSVSSRLLPGLGATVRESFLREVLATRMQDAVFREVGDTRGRGL